MSSVEKGSCSSWMVEMKKMLEQANPSMEEARWKQHSIYRVPEWIKDATDRKAYRPQLVSIGPFHHGEPHLLPMEEHKLRAVLHIVNRARKPLKDFVATIEEVVDELEGCYNNLDDKWRGTNRDSFVQMMVTDGCFLLELIRTDGIQLNEEEFDDYAANDPIFSKRSFHNLWPTLLNDMIVLENQLPLVVLQRLLAVECGTSKSARGINEMVLGLLDRHQLEEGMDILGLHLLDIYRKSYCGACPHWEGPADYEPRAPCAIELSEVGIQFKKSNTKSIHDIEFENGMLSMPLFEFYDSTGTILLNLMAFEWLHPGIKHDVASYIYFVDKIIESEKDVALLRSKGLFENFTGSDKKVVELFNTLTKLTWLPRGYKLGNVQWKLNAHCRKRRNKWWANFENSYMSNPWVFISLMAATILLVATLLQTIYTVMPFYKKS